MTEYVPADDGAHPPGEGPWWCETWWFGFWTPDRLVSGFTELTLLANQGRSWYRAALARQGRALLLIDELDAPAPRQGLEVKAEGLWADHVCEQPMHQWTLANEAYAVALDDPEDAIGRAYGTVTPMAFDLEWYATEAVQPIVDDARGADDAPGARHRGFAAVRGYRQLGEVHGVIELSGGALTVVGSGHRRHTWGPVALASVADRPDGPWVPFRLPAPFDVVVDDTLTSQGWVRTRRA